MLRLDFDFVCLFSVWAFFDVEMCLVLISYSFLSIFSIATRTIFCLTSIWKVDFQMPYTLYCILFQIHTLYLHSIIHVRYKEL